MEESCLLFSAQLFNETRTKSILLRMNIGLQVICDRIHMCGKGWCIRRSCSKDKVEIALDIDTAWAINAIGLHFHTEILGNGFKQIVNGSSGHECAWISGATYPKTSI